MDDFKLDALIAVRMLASLEVSPRWRTAVEMLDDAIERATAENVSIGVSPIFDGQRLDSIGRTQLFLAAQEIGPYNTD